MDATITTAGDYTNISFTKVIEVCPRVNTTLAIVSLNAIGGVTPVVTTEIPTIKDGNLIIEKIA